MVSVTSYTYPTETENDNSQFQSQTQSQGLSQSLRDSIEGNIAAFDAMEQSGLLDNCRTLSKDATFREVFRNILLYILDSFHIYRHDISGKLVSYFHVTPESANANYKTWIATTGMDSYIKIEQTGSDKFKVTDVYRESKGNSLKKQSRDRDFSGRNVKEFIGLLSEHDVLEKYQLSKVTVAANVLKQEIVNNNSESKCSFGVTDAERQLKKALNEQAQLTPDKLIPDDCSYKSDIKKLDVQEGEFSALLADASRHVGEGSSIISCCGVKINSTIHEFLRGKTMALSGHGGVRKYKDFEKLFSEIVFTPDECNIVRNSLQKDGVEINITENIISCLSSISGIGNLYYACLQAFPVALDRGDINAIQANDSVSAGLNNNPGFCALLGKTNFLVADFSQHTFTQTHYIVKAEINEAGNDFNIANFIYRTYGEDYIHNDSVDDSLNERSAEDYRFLDDSLLPENDFRNRRRNFSGNIAIATYK
ncbi:hypothetical protein ACOYWO_003361 [Escherichia coli]|uniref:hypothetical protein n=1 Tax=Escherichia coli TaxID=562 RepID=UPI000FB9224B|nr:hypothetical protein [Escherichia coli]EFC2859960.1 hypothetical protein [Escherichia coli]EFF4021343.1 hypothetical protein [Escherichia coli]EFG7706697.1 hypothetical protein [Escherichia coli]EFH2882438.1 hypothetical protein [Escherichia coli]EGM7578333.1 hypothetical protein [Escherichia coli]